MSNSPLGTRSSLPAVFIAHSAVGLRFDVYHTDRFTHRTIGVVRNVGEQQHLQRLPFRGRLAGRLAVSSAAHADDLQH
jgi:hypothetical protein